jgi:hypothetical protein
LFHPITGVFDYAGYIAHLPQCREALWLDDSSALQMAAFTMTENKHVQ